MNPRRLNPRRLTPRRSRLSVLLLALLSGAPLLADTPPEPPRFRIETVGQVNTADFSKILVHFRVVTPDGELARDLPDEEFVIYEDGKEVKRFRPRGRREPAVIVLGMDTSGSMDRSTRREGQAKLLAAKGAARRFFTRLDSATPCGLVLFHHEPYHLEKLTTNRDQLGVLIEKTEPKGGTAYFDACSEAIRMLGASGHPGQRSVVLMTDGRDVNSKRNLADVVQEAQRHKVRVYTVGLGEPGRSGLVRTVLVLDRSGSMAGKKITAMHKAASRFIELLPPQAADTTIIAFDDQISRAGPFSNNRPALLQQITPLTPRGQTALYDATYDGIETLNAARHLDQGPTRRALVVLSDGEDTDSHRRRETDVIERAKADGIKVFMLGLGQPGEINEPAMQKMARETGGEYFRVEDPDQLTHIFEELSIRLHDDGIDEASLLQLAQETGGEYFAVHDADKLAQMFERVAAELETTYSVTFESKRRRHDGTARGIEIRLGDLAVARTGYTTHGLITPMASPAVYLGLLLVLLALLGVPAGLRRLLRSTAEPDA